jgi:hypothetical protein
MTCDDMTIEFKNGDFSPFLRDCNKFLTEALKYSANEH